MSYRNPYVLFQSGIEPLQEEDEERESETSGDHETDYSDVSDSVCANEGDNEDENENKDDNVPLQRRRSLRARYLAWEDEEEKGNKNKDGNENGASRDENENKKGQDRDSLFTRDAIEQINANNRASISERRASTVSGRESSIGEHRAASISGKKSHNTYRMEPLPHQVFVWYKARNLIQKIANGAFQDFSYDDVTGPNMCVILSHRIMKKLKKFDWPRFRMVCHVTIAQLKGQGVMIASRALTTANLDSVAHFTFKNKDFVCVVIVYGIYYE